MEILYKAENCQISYDPDKQIMFCSWKGPQTKALIMSTGGVILKLFQEKEKDGCIRILNDNTLKTGIWHESVDFAIDEWFPLMVRAGLKHFAWVFSKDFFTEITAKQILQRIKTVRVAKAFKSYVEAYTWLVQQD